MTKGELLDLLDGWPNDAEVVYRAFDGRGDEEMIVEHEILEAYFTQQPDKIILCVDSTMVE